MDWVQSNPCLALASVHFDLMPLVPWSLSADLCCVPLWAWVVQASGIESELQRMGVDAKCYVAMRYWHPFTEEALDEMKRDGVNTLVVVPLYPQFSISTSGSSLRVLQDQFFKVTPLKKISARDGHTS